MEEKDNDCPDCGGYLKCPGCKYVEEIEDINQIEGRNCDQKTATY
jgi:hypothetical protein